MQGQGIVYTKTCRAYSEHMPPQGIQDIDITTLQRGCGGGWEGGGGHTRFDEATILHCTQYLLAAKGNFLFVL